MHAILSSRGAKIGVPWQPSALAPRCLAFLPLLLYHCTRRRRRTRAGGEHEHSLYLRGNIWWGKSFGAGEGGSLESEDQAAGQRRRRRLKLYDSQSQPRAHAYQAQEPGYMGRQRLTRLDTLL